MMSVTTDWLFSEEVCVERGTGHGHVQKADSGTLSSTGSLYNGMVLESDRAEISVKLPLTSYVLSGHLCVPSPGSLT